MLYYLLPFTIVMFLYLNKYSSWIFKEFSDKGFIPCGKCFTTLISSIYLPLTLLFTGQFTFVNLLTIVTFIFLNPILFVLVTKVLNKD